jgi:hypothetical protein
MEGPRVVAHCRERPPPAAVRPIVHIGYHKTATTWFQRHVYPAATSHRWVPRRVARRALLEPWGLAFDPVEARRQLADPADPRPPTICEENLSGYIHNGGLHGLMAPEAARRIHAVLPDARIVVVIRSQPDAIAASYVQYVRGGGTHGPSRYLHPARSLTGARRHPYKAPGFAFEHFEYHRLIAFYDALFGRESVTVLAYEDLCSDPAGFLTRYARTVGLSLDAGRAARHRPNGSFGPATLAVGRLLGLFTARSVVDKTWLIDVPGFYELRRIVLQGLGRLDRAAPPEAILGEANVARIRRRFAASNRETARLRGLDLARLGYPMEGRRMRSEPAPRPSPVGAYAATTGGSR